MPFEKVLHEFKEGTLKSGSGAKVTDRKQALAIALNYNREEGKKKKKKADPSTDDEDGDEAHPGFQAEQSKIASKEGIPMSRAGAILAASSRNASAAAKKKNPRLKRV